ncbi:phosphate ABC transporter permease PstA [Microbacterium oryzae]|uniref:Phosphate transport system permease protein PstA n=1 Tax=Microbacterium oryzae TaxID=743009 RepID=A0A6I6ECJ5_9MICO|nr:phosphate ABC transporter permease PstA [Microbacterium oryzae]QGU26261.1 phosphate ABC transporter permease PstA [Microbacterium oryzae]QGU28678.1 phosphate ABC transporter permease PstA [Microbacterium oryzae]
MAAIAASAQSMRLTSGRLPKWAPWALLLGSFAAAAVVFGVAAAGGDLADFNIAGTLIVGMILYIVLIAVVSSIAESSRKAMDRIMTALVSTAFVIALLPLVSLLWTVVVNGIQRFDAEFFTFSMRNIVGEGGGIVHAIWGTVLITLLAALIAVPVGLMTSIYLVEYGRGRVARAITFFVDVMTGIPSIVAGLFIYSVFALFVRPGISMGFMGALALAVLMIPVVVRGSEELLRIVPNELREAAYALGVPKWLTIVKVVLPTSIAGITTTVMLAIARVIGETAPLLLTAGYTLSLNTNLFDGQMMTLPVFAYNQYMNQGTNPDAAVARAWAAALTLIAIVMVLNLVARLIARLFAPKTAGR